MDLVLKLRGRRGSVSGYHGRNGITAVRGPSIPLRDRRLVGSGEGCFDGADASAAEQAAIVNRQCVLEGHGQVTQRTGRASEVWRFRAGVEGRRGVPPEDVETDIDALIADMDGGTCNQLLDLPLGFVAERTVQLGSVAHDSIA